MGTQLYNSKGEIINPITNADSVTIGKSNVLDKFGNLDSSLSTINNNIEGINSRISELKTSIDNSVGTIPEGLNSSFKSTVFKRTNVDLTKDDTPVGGEYSNPVPEGWFDAIPSGKEKLWASTRIFSSDGKYPQQEEWEIPRQMTDMAGFEVDFSEIVTNPGNPDTNPDNWSNEANENTIWMATKTQSNGVWGDWQVSKIKGEDGEDGTSIKIKGSFNTEEELKQTYPEGPTNDSDSYIIEGELWVWDGDSWQNVGLIKGEKGDTPYVHIKYANITTDSSGFSATVDGNSVLLIPTSGNGETPGKYIGMLVNYIENDLTEEIGFEDYTWTKWKGEDGWGYEYIYKLDNTTPNKPNSDNRDDYVPKDEGWEDDPLTPTSSKKYCYVSVRLKVDGVWREFSKPSVYTTYVVDGKSSLVINLLEDSCTVPCYNDGTLISGTHFGAGANQSFTTSLGLQILVFYGTTDVTESMSFSLENSEGLNASINQTTGYLEISGFDGNVRSGRTVITATNDTYGTVSHTFAVTKAYCGKDGTNAEFQYYQVKPSTNSITAIYNLSENKFTALTPTSLTLKVEKYTQNGRETLSSVPSGITLAAEFCDINNTLLNLLQNNTGVFDLSTMSVDTAYINASIVLGEDIIDTERIPVLWKLTGVTAEMPDWVTEWGGETTEIAGNKVLTGKLYAGEAPSQGQTDWKGILIGSKVASVENLPFDEYLNTTRDFSGILAVKNFDTNPGDNVFGDESDKAQVTFALDAETGDAYFNGEVHALKGVFNGTVYATDGSFTGEIIATKGTFTEGEITNSKISNLYVTSSGNNYNVIIGKDTEAVTINSTATSTHYYYFTINADGVRSSEDEITYDDWDLICEDDLSVGRDEQIIDLNDTNTSLYNTINNTFSTTPDYKVKSQVVNPITDNMEELICEAVVTEYNSEYSIYYKKEFTTITPIITMQCDSVGKTGTLQIVDLQLNGGYYSRTTMTGGDFKVEYSGSSSFNTITSFVKIMNNGIQITGMPSVPSGSHGFDEGVLYIDGEGIVRVSDGHGGYRKN